MPCPACAWATWSRGRNGHGDGADGCPPGASTPSPWPPHRPFWRTPRTLPNGHGTRTAAVANICAPACAACPASRSSPRWPTMCCSAVHRPRRTCMPACCGNTASPCATAPIIAAWRTAAGSGPPYGWKKTTSGWPMPCAASCIPPRPCRRARAPAALPSCCRARPPMRARASWPPPFAASCGRTALTWPRSRPRTCPSIPG